MNLNASPDLPMWLAAGVAKCPGRITVVLSAPRGNKGKVAPTTSPRHVIRGVGGGRIVIRVPLEGTVEMFFEWSGLSVCVYEGIV